MANPKRIPNRTVISIKGADAETFLKGLISNGPKQDKGCLSALLTPQGKILFSFYLDNIEDGYLFAVHSDAAEALLKRLTLYRLRAKVDIKIDDQYIACAIDDPDHPTACVFVSANQANTFTLFNDYEEKRIAAGIPEWGADFGSDEVFLMDVNYDALDGVNYKKGCFVGQEVTSRMKRKGEARKRTLIATFDSDPAHKGASVIAGESTLGTIMSSAGNKALALIRLDRWEKAVEAGTALEADGKALRLDIPDYLKQV